MDELKQKLVEACNNSGLPLEAIYYVTKDFFRDVSETYSAFNEEQKRKKEQDNKED